MESNHAAMDAANDFLAVGFPMVHESRAAWSRFQGRKQPQCWTLGIGNALGRNLERRVAASRPGTFILAGFAGALTDQYQTGDLVLGTGTSTPHLLEKAREILQRHNLNVSAVLGCSAEDLVDGPDAKQALHRAAGEAGFVDMESSYAWRVCQQQEIPMLTLRVILDPVNFVFGMDLRKCVQAETGALNHGSFVRSVGWNPALWLHIWRLSRLSARAGNSLKRGLRTLVAELQ